MIVTETPAIEIDGRIFKMPYLEAKKYLVQIKEMSPKRAQERVQELINQTLDKPKDKSRRSFLQQT
jgi:hypothetical protein